MRCSYCGYENLLKAHYCQRCGYRFSDTEKKKARGKTFFGMVDNLLELKAWLTLDKITGNIPVRILVILILAGLVAFNIFRNGSDLAIKQAGKYTVAYQEAKEEYYVLTNFEEVDLNIYVPRGVDRLELERFENGVLEDERLIEKGDDVRVERTDTGYYTLTARYTDGEIESILFFVCDKDAKEVE